jgi:FMN reductase
VNAPRIVAVSGNPRPGSRTLTLVRGVAERIAAAAQLPADAVTTVDLLDYAPRLFDRQAKDVKGLVEFVATADLVVVASPTYKGSYTGLLKAFIDQFPRTGLSGVTAVPLMVGVLAHHTDVHDRLLGPLLGELEAAVLPGLFFLEEELAEPDRVIDGWLAAVECHLLRTLGPVAPRAAWAY